MPDKQTSTPTLTVDSQCALRECSPALRAEIKELLTIANPKYRDAKRYGRWIGKNLQPELLFFQEQDDTLFFPRGFANQAVLRCREIEGRDPRLLDKRRKLDELDAQFYGTARPYQREAVEAVLKRSFGVLEAGTGSGKTVMALQVIAERKQPTLIVVHNKELFYQWLDRIEEFLHIRAGRAGDGCFDPGPVTVAIVNTARNRLSELAGLFGQIIVDECHRVPASLFVDVVSAFDSYYMLGLSATAFRREDGMTRLIHIYMGDPIYRVNFRDLAASGAVVRPEVIRRETAFFYAFQGEYSRMIKALAADYQRNAQICADIGEMIAGGHEGTVLVVSDRVAHCEILAEKVAAADVEVAVLTGRVSKDKRAAIVQAVRENKVKVLFSTLQLISEGFDCPGLSTLVLATPIKFEGRLLQVVGRVMRPADGKKARVIDYIDVKIPLLEKSAEARRRVLHSL